MIRSLAVMVLLMSALSPVSSWKYYMQRPPASHSLQCGWVDSFQESSGCVTSSNQFSSSGCIVQHSCLVLVDGTIWVQACSMVADLLANRITLASLWSLVLVSSLLELYCQCRTYHSSRRYRIPHWNASLQRVWALHYIWLAHAECRVCPAWFENHFDVIPHASTSDHLSNVRVGSSSWEGGFSSSYVCGNETERISDGDSHSV